MPEEVVASAENQAGSEEVEQEQSNALADAAGEDEQHDHTDEQSEQHRKPSGYQRAKYKIQRLNEENQMLRDLLVKQGKAVESEKPADKPVAKSDDDPRPKLDDFETADDYYVALGKWGARQELTEREKRQAAKAEETKKQEAQKTFKQKVDDQHEKGRKAHEDFDELVAENPKLQITPVMAEAIIDSEIGEEIAYELGKNPAEAERIAKLSPASQAREIGKIEARLVKQEQKAEGDEAPKEDPPKPPVSRAPAPIKPVQKGTGTTKVDLNDPNVPYKDWLKEREAQLAKQR